MRRYRQRFAAVFLSLVVNALLVVLLTKVNVLIDDQPPEPPAKTRTITIHEPPPKKQPKPKPTTRRRAPRPRPSSVPNLPSPVTVPGLVLSDTPAHDFTAAIVGELDALSADFVFKEEAVDTPPKVVSRVLPKYPRWAEKSGVEGFVIFKLKLTQDGRIEKLWTEDAKPAGVFEAEAEKAVRQYRFSPARLKGKPVAVICRQKIEFRLGG